MSVRDVLVVEDEPDLAATYERILRRQGCRVAWAASRAAGLAALQASEPDLLIADVQLPDGDGLDVVRAARGRPTPTAVIVVTGFASRAQRDAAIAAGATAFLAKPFATQALTELVRSLLEPRPC